MPIHWGSNFFFADWITWIEISSHFFGFQSTESAFLINKWACTISINSIFQPWDWSVNGKFLLFHFFFEQFQYMLYEMIHCQTLWACYMRYSCRYDSNHFNSFPQGWICIIFKTELYDLMSPKWFLISRKKWHICFNAGKVECRKQSNVKETYVNNISLTSS